MHPNTVGYKLKLITDRVKVHADANLRSENLTLTQSHVLAFIHENGGTVSQKDIEEHMSVSHPTVVGVVSRMEQNGFVTTWLDPKDRRVKLVKETEKARITNENMKHHIEETDSTMLKGLTPEEISDLSRYLDTIYRNLK